MRLISGCRLPLPVFLNMVKLVLACFMILCPAYGFAAGTTALPFLKIDAGARAAALGGAYSAAGSGASSVFYNPAGTALVDRAELEVSHNEWIAGLRNETLSYAQALNEYYTVFGGANLLLSGGMGKYDDQGAKTGSFYSLESSLSSGLSVDFGGDYYGAAAVKWLYQKADEKAAGAFAGDAGLLKIAGVYRFGAAVSNLGSKMKLGSRAFDLPLILRAGAARRLNERFWLLTDIVKPGESGVAVCAGAESEFSAGGNGTFFVRAGYRSGRSRYAGSGVTAGLGIKNGDLRLDYAFAPYGELGDAHRVTLSLRFGRSRAAIPVKTKYPRGYVKPPPSKTRPLNRKKTQENEKNNEQEDERIVPLW